VMNIANIQGATHAPNAEIAKAEMEATRARAEAGKEIVATVFRGIMCLGVFGIAAGATAIVLHGAAPELHLLAIVVIWICATVVSTATVLGGLLERQRVHLRRLMGGKTVQLELDEANRLMSAIQE